MGYYNDDYCCRGTRFTFQIPPVTPGIINFADFFATMPPDNAVAVAPGSNVLFPSTGANGGTAITRLTTSTFNLATIGTYMVQFQVSVTQAGQLVLTLNGTELAYTVAGRANGIDQITGMALVTTTTPNSVLTLRNPIGNIGSLTITPSAGGASAVTAHLVILKLTP